MPSRTRKRKPKNGPVWWPCETTGKRSYASKLDALTVASRTARTRKAQRPYYCKHCERWHITGQRKRAGRRLLPAGSERGRPRP